MKHPGLSLFWQRKPVVSESLPCRFEELFDLSLSELLMEARSFLRPKVSPFPLPVCFGKQLNMSIIQRTEDVAEDFEELIIVGLIRHLGSVDFELLFPVYLPQFEKWVAVVEGLPEKFEILDGVAHDHNQGARLGTNHTMISEVASWIA